MDTKGSTFPEAPNSFPATSVISLCSCFPPGYINVTLLTVIFQAILKIFLHFPLLLATWPQPTGMPVRCHSSLSLFSLSRKCQEVTASTSVDLPVEGLLYLAIFLSQCKQTVQALTCVIRVWMLPDFPPLGFWTSIPCTSSVPSLAWWMNSFSGSWIHLISLLPLVNPFQTPQA